MFHIGGLEGSWIFSLGRSGGFVDFFASVVWGIRGFFAGAVWKVRGLLCSGGLGRAWVRVYFYSFYELWRSPDNGNGRSNNNDTCAANAHPVRLGPSLANVRCGQSNPASPPT